MSLDEDAAWRALGQVPDPEIPVISITELGIVREIACSAAGVRVTVTPTYGGCPATEVIQQEIRSALLAAGASAVEIRTQLAPPWTTDWIGEEARRKLRHYGIVPPCRVNEATDVHPVIFRPPLRCPRCDALTVENLSTFGATPCKALYRCLACGEPFEYFKPI